jgi:hypothetical protein
VKEVSSAKLFLSGKGLRKYRAKRRAHLLLQRSISFHVVGSNRVEGGLSKHSDVAAEKKEEGRGFSLLL